MLKIPRYLNLRLRPSSTFKYFCNVTILFFLVHSFYIHPPINSSFTTPILCILAGYICNRNFITSVNYLIHRRKIIHILSAILVLFTISLIIPIAHKTYDFSYSKNFMMQLIQFFIIIIVSGFIFHIAKESKEKISQYAAKLIVSIFVIQSCIEIAAFLSPKIAAFIHLFYRADAIEQLSGYEGVRGLALTGSPGWGLAVGFALSVLFYVKIYVLDNKIRFWNVIIGVFLVLGIFFAGRSGFIGLIMGVILYFISRSDIGLKCRNILYALSYLCIMIAAVYMFFPNFVELLVDRVFPFAFEFYYKYNASGVLQTNSTNILFRMWSVPVDYETYFIGTGFFTDPVSGRYYMRVDVGYLRNLFFGGLAWCFLMVSYQALIGGMGCIIFKEISKKEKVFICILFASMLIFEAKAMALGFLKYPFTISLFYYFSLIYEYEIIPRISPKKMVNEENIDFNNNPCVELKIPNRSV